jgi:hypothetical protein
MRLIRMMSEHPPAATLMLVVLKRTLPAGSAIVTWILPGPVYRSALLPDKLEDMVTMVPTLAFEVAHTLIPYQELPPLLKVIELLLRFVYT